MAATELCAKMSLEIADAEPIPIPQQGMPVVFKRRTPEQSRLPETGSITQLYDHIRMLDAEGYPKAFCPNGDYSITFQNAKIDGDTIVATAVISKNKA